MGKAAFFIRTFGCPIKCEWCDSAGTWHPDYVPESVARYSIDQLLKAVTDSGAPICVITGGEPTIHDLLPLTVALKAAGVRTHLETSGAYEIKGIFDWITLSPKWAKLPLQDNVYSAHEIKLIVENEESMGKWLNACDFSHADTIWLHPEWTKKADLVVLRAITEYVKKNPRRFRAGWQLHKLYRADNFDSRAAVAAPLGGDPSKGY